MPYSPVNSETWPLYEDFVCAAWYFLYVYEKKPTRQQVMGFVRDYMIIPPIDPETPDCQYRTFKKFATKEQIAESERRVQWLFETCTELRSA